MQATDPAAFSSARVAPHRQAFKAWRGHFFSLLVLLGLNLLVRLLALSPLFYTLATKKALLPLAGKWTIVPGLLASVLLYLLLVMPFRFQSRAILSRITNAQDRATTFGDGHFFRWLAAGLLRFFKALPWLLPLIAVLAGFYYYWNLVGFNEFGLMVRQVGALVGGEYVAGVALLVAAFLVSALLASYGWWRGMPLDYQPVAEIGPWQSARRAQMARRQRLHHFARTTLVNALMCLPALIVLVLLLALHLKGALTGSLQWDVPILISTLTELRFPASLLLQWGGALLALYLPFVYLRKAALAAAVGDASRRAQDAL